MSVLGFDTSNYTASAAWTDGERDISVRQLLSVKPGERGIRQSEGLFQHVKLLPDLFERLAARARMDNVTAVGVSTRPRNAEGSYMPVFLAGEGYARAISAALNVPLYRFSHQDGHIMAGIYSCKAYELMEKEFISVHISGGTTEILKSGYRSGNFSNRIIGGTRDISAGQLIDRTGVKLGLLFPAGRELERLAYTADRAFGLPASADGAYMNFSGAETRVMRASSDTSAAEIALGVLECVRDTLIKTIRSAMKSERTDRVLIVGGVASNRLIREGLKNGLDGYAYFARPEYSTDNAVGIAQLAYFASKED